MVEKKIIFFGKIDKNIQHGDCGTLAKGPRSIVNIDTNGSMLNFTYRHKNYNKIELFFNEGGLKNAKDKAQKVVNSVQGSDDGFHWLEITFDKKQMQVGDGRFTLDQVEPTQIKRWSFTNKDITFQQCEGLPEDKPDGTLIHVASMKVEENIEVSPLVETILLENVHGRNDIKKGIKDNREYIIKGATSNAFPISSVYDNNGLTLRITNASEIIDKNKTSSWSTTSQNTNQNSTDTDNKQNSNSGIPFQKPVDENKKVRDFHNSQYFWENHPDLVEFKKTRAKLYGEGGHNGYSLRTDKESHRQVIEKKKSLNNFRSLFENMTVEQEKIAKEFNESELNKRRELTKLMKEVMSEIDKSGSSFPEMSYGPADSLKSLREETVKAINNTLSQEPKVKENDLNEENCSWRSQIFGAKDIGQINSIKDKVLNDIKIKRELRISAKDLTDSIKKAEKSGSASDIKEAVKKAEKGRGLESYEENKVEINKLKEKLTAKDYQEVVKNVTQEIMKETGLSEKELGQELAKKIQNVNGSQLTKEEVKNLEEELIPQLNREGWLSWIKKKVKLVDEYAEKAKRNLTKALKDDLKKIKDDLNSFINDRNVYKQTVYQENETEVKNSLVKLDQYISKQVQNPSSEGKLPLKTIIPLSLAGVVVVGVGLAIIINKKRKSKIEIEE